MFERFSRSARVSVVLAQEEARELNRTFGADAYDNALRKSGRRGRRRGHIPFTKPAKKVLELALREALAHKDNWIGCGVATSSRSG